MVQEGFDMDAPQVPAALKVAWNDLVKGLLG